MDKDGLTDTGQLCESKTRQGLKVAGITFSGWYSEVSIRDLSLKIDMRKLCTTIIQGVLYKLYIYIKENLINKNVHFH